MGFTTVHLSFICFFGFFFRGFFFWFLFLVVVPSPRLCSLTRTVCTGRYYDCTIQEVTAHGYKVVFPAYGNVEEVPLEYLQKKITVSQAKVSRALLCGEKTKRVERIYLRAPSWPRSLTGDRSCSPRNFIICFFGGDCGSRCHRRYAAAVRWRLDVTWLSVLSPVGVVAGLRCHLTSFVSSELGRLNYGKRLCHALF